MRVLHSFSGGIDSTSVLYQLVKQGHDVVALHIDIVYKNALRWQAEQVATDKILKWLADQGYKIKYIYGGRTELTGVWNDIEVTALHTGNHLRADKTIEATTENCSSTDLLGAGCVNRNMNRWIITEIIACRRPVWIKPNIKKTREQVIKEMPSDLLKLTHFCRRPIPKDEGFENCKKCHTCRATLQFLPKD